MSVTVARMPTDGVRTRRRHGVQPMLAVVVISLLVPAGASGAVVQMQAGTLVVEDRSEESNFLDVLPRGLLAQEVFDASGNLVAGTGCANVSERLIRCTGLLRSVDVLAGGGDDVVDLSDVDTPTSIQGGAGDDALAGGLASDNILGDDGEDSIFGGIGFDRLVGGVGADLMEGAEGPDTIIAGLGDDIADGSEAGGDVVLGGDGRDLLRGGGGDDQVEGGSDDDALIGGDGNDSVGTGLGADMVFGADGQVDRVDCRGRDMLRGDGDLHPDSCGSLPPAVTVPTEWPPPESAPADATAAVTVYRVKGDTVRDNRVRRIFFFIEASFDARKQVDVRIRVRDRRRTVRRYCVRDRWTETGYFLDVNARAADNVRGTVLSGRLCR